MAKYLLADIDLTRHVRTPAGVAYFHKPIGSPIGGRGGAAPRAAKIASGLEGKAFGSMKPREKVKAAEVMYGTGSKQHRAAQKKLTPVDLLSRQPHVTSANFKGREPVSADDALGTGLYKTAAKKASKPHPLGLTEADAADVRKDILKPTDVNDTLWQLDAARLNAAIKDPRTPKNRLVALKREKAQRVQKASELLSMKKEFDKGFAKVAATKSPGKIRSFVHAHAPKSLAKIFDRVAGQDHAGAVTEAVWDFAIKSILPVAFGVLGVHLIG